MNRAATLAESDPSVGTTATMVFPRDRLVPLDAGANPDRQA